MAGINMVEEAELTSQRPNQSCANNHESKSVVFTVYRREIETGLQVLSSKTSTVKAKMSLSPIQGIIQFCIEMAKNN